MASCRVRPASEWRATGGEWHFPGYVLPRDPAGRVEGN